MRALWGLDLGGTKIEGVVLDADNQYSVLQRARIPTEANKGYEHILSQIKTLIRMLESDSGITCNGFGIGTPGMLDPKSGLMKNSNTTCLIGQPFKSDIEKQMGFKIKMTNDANCFAMAETFMGIIPDVAPEAEVVFGVIMGTGVGGGIVVNGKILNGHHGIAGEWGHNVLIPNGVPCYCGKKGCVEKVIAGPSLERYYREISGNTLKLKDIVTNYHNGGDEYADATIKRLTKYFGEAIAYVVNILDPDAIVIGGGVGNIDEIYTKGKEEAVKHVFNNTLNTPILKPKLGDSAGVFGAALL